MACGKHALGFLSDAKFLPQGLRGDTPKDTPQSLALWHRLKLRGDESAFQPLWAHYAPLALNVARVLKLDNPSRFFEPLDDLISDGLLGMADAIRRMQWPRQNGAVGYLWFRVKCAIKNFSLDRRWEGRAWWETQQPVEKIRSDLVQQLGRVPTPQEMTARLTGLIKNPLLYVNEPKRVLSASCEREAKQAWVACADRTPTPDGPSLRRELMALARRHLSKPERAMLRMLLRGQSHAQIAERLGLERPTVRKRLNGVLWELRCRADLAEYLGVEPHLGPVPKNAGRVPVSIHVLPPARLAV